MKIIHISSIFQASDMKLKFLMLNLPAFMHLMQETCCILSTGQTQRKN